MIRVLIADDHAIVRQGLHQILAGEADMTVAGEAASGEELLRMARDRGWDMVVLDLSLPGVSGLDVQRELKHIAPDLPALILSVHAEDQYAIRALRAGARGYLTKEAAPEELVNAIRTILAGDKYVSPSMAQQLAEHVASQTPEHMHEALSDREFEVLRLLVAGKRVKEIAEAMGLSPKTVSTYRSRVLEKMHMESNADLVQYAIQERLIDPGPTP